MSILFELFLIFAKIGLFTFGGGYAMLSLIENNCVEKKKWITHDEMMNVTVIAESTPGPIGVNMATYVGFTTAGIPGSIIATVGLITPSIIIILIIAGFLKAFQDSKYVKSAFYGLRPASTGLIAAAGLSVVALVVLQKDLYAESHNLIDLINLPNIVLMVILYFFTARFKKTKGLHPVVFIAASAVIGIVFRFGGAV